MGWVRTRGTLASRHPSPCFLLSQMLKPTEGQCQFRAATGHHYCKHMSSWSSQYPCLGEGLIWSLGARSLQSLEYYCPSVISGLTSHCRAVDAPATAFRPLCPSRGLFLHWNVPFYQAVRPCARPPISPPLKNSHVHPYT